MVTSKQEKSAMDVLDRMSHVRDAGYICGNSQGCMKGTRRGVLSRLEDWLNNEQDKHIFWLNGLAGTGKSTIAQTFAGMCFADGKLGASFFCSRDFEGRNNLQSVFPTLASQLAYKYPQFREVLLAVLATSPDIGQEPLFSQMEKLIVGPLYATQTQTIIIIDALDECQDKAPTSALLSALSCYVDRIPLVKFFITGRPEPRIYSGFCLQSLQPCTSVLNLHEVEPSLVDHDIKLFLQAQFLNIAKNRSDCNLEDDWPGQHSIEILGQKAAGYFIYASTVMNLISSSHHLPNETLSVIIMLPQHTSHEGKLVIDLPCTEDLEEAFHNIDLSDQSFFSHLKPMVGVVALVINILSIKTLSNLLGNNSTPL